MTPPHAQPVSLERPRADAAARGAAASAEGPYVINLCSSTTPMALSQPRDPALARFTFFVSRRLEDGRERFRLHMGHFETLPDAEEWLSVVREIYPGAWAGEAPGKRLRAQAAAAAEAASSPAPTNAQSAPRGTAAARPIATPHSLAAPQSVAAPKSFAAPQSVAAPASVASPQPVAAPQPIAAPQPTALGLVEPPPAADEAPASETLIELTLSEVPPAQRVIPANIPVLQAAPVTEGRQSTASATPQAPLKAGTATVTAAAKLASAITPTPAAAPVAADRTTAASAAGSAVIAKSAAAAPIAAQSKSAAAKSAARPLPLSNVREVLASLDETAATRQMPALASASVPTAAPQVQPSVAKVAASPGKGTVSVPGKAAVSAPSTVAAPASSRPRGLSAAAPQIEVTEAPREQSGDSDQSLSDTQVLKLLEGRRSDGSRAEEDSSISLLKPDDTGTRRALKEAVTGNAPVSFAVQLQWSVQPIDVAKVPPLAIFSAYTLYTVEGSREGRRWYGLRLGFFTDAISAKQVAHYVRSEFSSVAVVPVSPHERGRASDGGKGAAAKPAAPKSPLKDRLPEPTAEFKLIDDEPAPRAPEPPAATIQSRAPAAKPQASAPPAKRGSRSPSGRVRAREKRSPQTLEETLEILGADQLEIDQGRGEVLNDTGVRHLSVQVRKNSPFTKLLDRLAERARGK